MLRSAFDRLTCALSLQSRFGLALVAVGMISGCPRGDVGAPCNHGDVVPPESQLVTFPALACNDLLCVYADQDEVPARPCANDGDCNQGSLGGEQKYGCVVDDGQGKCRLLMEHVLERSMCSRKCESNADCQDGGPGQKVLDPDTNCESGFRCARIQKLGTFCCQRLCVCEDDLGVDNELDMACDSGTARGCCIDSMGEPIQPTPEGCGG